MAVFPILKPGRVADLTALIRHLATCDQEQREANVLDMAIPNLSVTTRDIVSQHPDLFRVSGKSDSVSLWHRFLVPGRPKLNDEQTAAIIETSVNQSHRQALEQSRHNLEWWKWVTSFLSGGVVGAIVLELVRHFLSR